jgi:aminomethyltransferase
LPPGVERYRVIGGGAVVVPVFAGDKLTVIDKEGRQRAELAAFTADARFEPGMLGAKAAGPAMGINRLLAGDGEDAAVIAAALKRRGLPPQIDRAIALFEHDSVPGESAEFTVERDGFVVLHAVGQAMTPEEQTPPTDLILFIHRSRLPERSEPVLPPPWPNRD